MSLQVFNTLSRTKEIFQPLQGNHVGFYACGPTVYDYQHIGNLKAYVTWDLVKRTLQFLGYEVKHVMNITDVGHLVSDDDTGEDKMEKGAQREGKTVWEIAKFYTRIFFDDLQKLNVLTPDIICKATDHIPEQIALVQKLTEKGFTYVIEDGVYFDTSKLSDYGKLARLDIEGLQSGARVEVVSGKKNITDFALWKFSYPGGRSFDFAQDDSAKRRQMEWESPWGIGFPGWHIECSAMSMRYLGETFDVHSGGVDHIPVHHTNEIAQSEAATGQLFVRYWLHNNHILVDGKKMSKSLGNFYRLDQLIEKGYSPRAVRYLFLSSHYRQQQNFTFDALTQATNTLASIDQFVRSLLTTDGQAVIQGIEDKLQEASQQFQAGLEDDFNLPEALTALFNVIRIYNPILQDGNMSQKDARKILDWLKNTDRVLGVLQFEFTEQLSPEVEALVREREEARKNKNFALSDELRGKIEALGYVVKDTAQGQKVGTKSK